MKIQSVSTKVLNVIVSIGLILSLILNLFVMINKRTIQSKVFIESLLQKTTLTQNIHDLLVEKIINSSTSDPVLERFFTSFTQGQLNQAVEMVIPDNYLLDQQDQLIGDYLNYVGGKVNEFSLQVDLTPIKNNLAGQAGRTAFLFLIDHLPACGASDLSKFAQSILKTPAISFAQIPFCNPGNKYLSLLEPFINSFLKQISGNIPSGINLNGLAQNAALNSSQTNMFLYFILLYQNQLYLEGLFFALLLLLLIVNLRSIRIFFSVFGISAVIAGISTSLVYLSIPILVKSYFLAQMVGISPDSLRVAVNNFANAALPRISTMGFWAGAITCLAGLGLLGIGKIIKKN